MLCVVKLGAIKLSVIAILQSVIRMTIIILNVVAPLQEFLQCLDSFCCIHF